VLNPTDAIDRIELSPGIDRIEFLPMGFVLLTILFYPGVKFFAVVTGWLIEVNVISAEEQTLGRGRKLIVVTDF